MFANIGDVRVHYKTSGEGRNIVLLHGWGVDSKTFEAVHKFLEKNFKVYSLDFPGFGQSAEPPEPWGVEQYADFLAAFLKQFNIDDPILIGHSFGCRVSLYHASRNPVRKLIFTGAAGIKPKRKFMYYMRVYTYKFCRKLLKLPIINKKEEELLKKLKARFGSSDYKNVSGVMQQTFVKVVNEDLKFLMPKIKAPTLLIFGENDTATPVEDGKTMEHLIPDAGLVVIKNAGHYAFLEKINEFLVIIDSFLQKDKEAQND
jgi:pimeloyl-ACP methyl ester carboxylesterase